MKRIFHYTRFSLRYGIIVFIEAGFYKKPVKIRVFPFTSNWCRIPDSIIFFWGNKEHIKDLADLRILTPGLPVSAEGYHPARLVQHPLSDLDDYWMKEKSDDPIWGPEELHRHAKTDLCV
jgi:hypothetical protein